MYIYMYTHTRVRVYFSYTSRGHDEAPPTTPTWLLADAAMAFAHVLQTGDPFIGAFA